MKTKHSNAFPILHPNAAGIDISSKEHYVAVNPEMSSTPIKPFGCFTEDLKAIADWLKECSHSIYITGGYRHLLGEFVFTFRGRRGCYTNQLNRIN